MHQEANGNKIFGGSNWFQKEGSVPISNQQKLRALNKATEWMDKAEHQKGKYSPTHAMSNRNTNQSTKDAMRDADKFVRRQFNKAIGLLNQGKWYDSYFEFGKGLHTLQDATSPAHNGFQPWGDKESNMNIYKHIIKEGLYPGRNSNLQKVRDYYIDWFENPNRPALKNDNLFSNIKSD